MLNRLREETPFKEVPIRLIVRERRRAELDDLLSGRHQQRRSARGAGRGAGAGEGAAPGTLEEDVAEDDLLTEDLLEGFDEEDSGESGGGAR